MQVSRCNNFYPPLRVGGSLVSSIEHLSRTMTRIDSCIIIVSSYRDRWMMLAVVPKQPAMLVLGNTWNRAETMEESVPRCKSAVEWITTIVDKASSLRGKSIVEDGFDFCRDVSNRQMVTVSQRRTLASLERHMYRVGRPSGSDDN
ncbi:hypothetical protein ABKN59_009114 [Abortiporus biennis]